MIYYEFISGKWYKINIYMNFIFDYINYLGFFLKIGLFVIRLQYIIFKFDATIFQLYDRFFLIETLKKYVQNEYFLHFQAILFMKRKKAKVFGENSCFFIYITLILPNLIYILAKK
ncbi:hypothetical protein EDEG_01815, partial [Edhazardia aedis USNM 41457]